MGAVQIVKTPLAALLLVSTLLLGACASAPLERTGALSSYETMTQIKSTRARALYMADPAALAAARTVRLEPVTISEPAASRITEGERALLANAVGRTLCNRLDDRFEVVAPPADADLVVKVTITGVTPTAGAASAASVALSIASPVPFTPRLPIGLGAFSAEGEALNAEGRQAAALVWARGADIFATDATVSKVGDAYQLSGAFAKDMARLMTTGRDPFARGRRGPGKEDETEQPAQQLPSPACAAYGRAPGAAGFIARRIGAPPDWTDRGAAEPAPAPPPDS